MTKAAQCTRLVREFRKRAREEDERQLARLKLDISQLAADEAKKGRTSVSYGVPLTPTDLAELRKQLEFEGFDVQEVTLSNGTKRFKVEWPA